MNLKINGFFVHICNLKINEHIVRSKLWALWTQPLLTHFECASTQYADLIDPFLPLRAPQLPRLDSLSTSVLPDFTVGRLNEPDQLIVPSHDPPAVLHCRKTFTDFLVAAFVFWFGGNAKCIREGRGAFANFRCARLCCANLAPSRWAAVA